MSLQPQSQPSLNQAEKAKAGLTSHSNSAAQAITLLPGQEDNTMRAQDALVIPLAGLHRDQLALVGSKAANLGEMIGSAL